MSASHQINSERLVIVYSRQVSTLSYYPSNSVGFMTLVVSAGSRIDASAPGRTREDKISVSAVVEQSIKY